MNKYIKKFFVAGFIVVVGFLSNAYALENKEIAQDNKTDDKVETKKVEGNKTKTNRAIINDEVSLINAINNATGSTTLSIAGGTTIKLNASLKINTDNLNNVTFVSDNSNEVILKNADTAKHLEVSGAKALSLKFDKVILDGDNLNDGGITLNNNAKDNVISGLVARNILINTIESGIITSKNSNVSLSIKDGKFTNNGIPRAFAINTSLVFFKGIGSSLNLVDTDFVENKVNSQGGSSIFFNSENGIADFENLKITNTDSTGATGGIFYIGAGNSKLNVNNSKFSENKNTSLTGGAALLRVKDNSSATFTKTSFTNNYGDDGGGAIDIDLYGGEVSFDDVNFDKNTASMMEYDPNTGTTTGVSSNGGAINISQSSSNTRANVDIKNSKFTNNNAVSGGAIDLYNGYEAKTFLTIENSVINNNLADYHGGAIDINYSNSTNEAGQYKVINTEMKNNVITGKDTGPNYYHGGYGGAIYFDLLSKYPDVLVLDDVDFANNKSPYPIVWNHISGKDDYFNKMYSKNVTNTNFSDNAPAGLDAFNNAYNGNDVYPNYNALTYYTPNPDNLADLNLSNYDDVKGKYAYFYSQKGSYATPARTPISPNYNFLGWYDANGNKWNFSTNIQNEVHNRLYAKWELKTSYQVNFDLNEAPSAENEHVVEQVNVKENEVIADYKIPTWDTKAQFAGWYTVDQQGNYVKKWDFKNDKVTSDMKLVARWQVNVKFLIDGKVSNEYPTKTFDRKLSIIEADKIKAKLTDLTWYTDKEMNKKADLNVPILENIILYSSKGEIDKPTPPIETEEKNKDNHKKTNKDKSKNTKQNNGLPKSGFNNSVIIFTIVSLLIIGSGTFVIRKKYNK